MSQIPGWRVTSAGRLAAALLAGLALAGLIGACGSTGAGTSARPGVPSAVAHAATSTDSSAAATSTDTSAATTRTEVRTVTQPAQTVTRTVQLAPPTTTISHTTTNVAVIPTSTTADQGGDQIPWWGWLLIGIGGAAVAVGLFAAGHHRGARRASGAHDGGAQGGATPRSP